MARENLEDIGEYVGAVPSLTRGAAWYTIFFAFQACLTLLLSLVAEPHHANAGAWRAVLASTAQWFRHAQAMATVSAVRHR
jgi:transcriptional regulatory protein GAL4